MLGLLIRRQRQRRVRIGNAAHYQAVIVAPGQRCPLVILVLIAEDAGGLECLAMVDPEYAAVERCALRDQPSHLRKEISRARVAERPICLEAVQVGGADAAGDAIQFRVVPGNRNVRVVFNSVPKS
jgi:hypothetical protein